MAASSARTSLGVFVGFDFLRDAFELGLVFMQIGVANLEQPVERSVDHLVVEQFL